MMTRPLTRDEREKIRLEIDRKRREKIRKIGDPGKGGSLLVPATLLCESKFSTGPRVGSRCSFPAKLYADGRAYCGMHAPRLAFAHES